MSKIGDQVVASESEISDIEDEESFFQDCDLLQNHGIVSFPVYHPFPSI